MSRIGVIAFSGGLDTSFLARYAREQYGLEKVITCTVNTGGFSAEELETIALRSKECGADEHVAIDAEQEFYDTVIKYLVFGNVSRDGYPLSVGSERLIQAKNALSVCTERNADCILHGSTGAGNDQFRFDTAVYVLAQGTVECIAPVREFNFSRDFTSGYLQERGIVVAKKNTAYSYNVGLWGVSIGGTETHSSTGLIPDTAWYHSPRSSLEAAEVSIQFERGEPTSATINGNSVSGTVSVIKALAAVGNDLGIGRHYHVGTSIPGKKGRLAYESPAADLLYEAHRTLEKIVLTQSQIQTKQFIGNEYGKCIHEAKFFDPYVRDLQAFLESSQQRVTGEAVLHLKPFRIESAVADSPYNLLRAKGATYGETSNAYTGADAAGAAKIYALEQMLYHQKSG